MTSTDLPSIDPGGVSYAFAIDYLTPDNEHRQLKQVFSSIEEGENALYAQVATGMIRFTPKDYGDYPGAPFVLYIPIHRVLHMFVYLEMRDE